MIPNEIARCPSLSAAALRVYVFLSTYNPCFTSYRAIRKGTGFGFTRIQTAIKELVKAGWIEYDRGNSRKKANLYRVNFSRTTVPMVGVVDVNRSHGGNSTVPISTDEPFPFPPPNKTNGIIPMKKGDLQKMLKAEIQELAKKKEMPT